MGRCLHGMGRAGFFSSQTCSSATSIQSQRSLKVESFGLMRKFKQLEREGVEQKLEFNL